MANLTKTLKCNFTLIVNDKDNNKDWNILYSKMLNYLEGHKVVLTQVAQSNGYGSVGYNDKILKTFPFSFEKSSIKKTSARFYNGPLYEVKTELNITLPDYCYVQGYVELNNGYKEELGNSTGQPVCNDKVSKTFKLSI